MNFDIRPLSDALGAEVIGLDVSKPLDAETFARVHQAHLDFLVLVFRDQNLTPQQHIDFTKRFGPLDHHPADDAVLPGYPDILVVSTKKENGEYIGIPDGGPMWHADLTYREKGSIGSMLYALEIPDAGGKTGFANMYRAYDSLPKHLKNAIEGKRGLFMAGRRHAQGSFKRLLSEAQEEDTPAMLHALVRTHPETGRKCVFANPQHTLGIEGMDEDEAKDILAELFALSTKPEFTYFHDWRVGDLTFWDNRCTQHIADHTRLEDPSYIRHMHRTTLAGDVAF